jgi:hypothetical protein
MDSSRAIHHGALHQMEMQLSAWLDERCTGPAHHSTMYQQHAIMYVDDVGSDLDDGPFFDNESFVNPVFDDVPDSDHAAATMLNFATSTCAIHDQADPNDLNDDLIFDNDSDTLTNGIVFDIEIDYNHATDAAIEFTESVFNADFAFSDKGPSDISPVQTSDVLDGDLLFSKEPKIEDAVNFTQPGPCHRR